jgi:hypothetical protein
MDSIFTTSVISNLFSYFIGVGGIGVMYFTVGSVVLLSFGFYYHHSIHDESSGNTLRYIHNIHFDEVSVLLARFILGSVFFIMGGLHGIFEFVPTKKLEIPADAIALLEGLKASGYLFPAVKTVELVTGFMFFFGIYIPLALLIAAPIILNIGMYHLFLEQSGLIVAIPLAISALYLTHRHRSYFKPFFNLKADLDPMGITKKESDQIKEILDEGEQSNIPHLNPDKLAWKSFVLLTMICLMFILASIIIL